MANWLRNIFKKKEETKPLENFVLYSDSKTEGTDPSESGGADTSFTDTDRLDIPPHLLKEKKSKLSSFFEERKKLILSIGVSAIALLLVVALLLIIPPLMNPLRGYAEATVIRGNVISSMKVSGTLSANAHYSITSLVSGTVLNAPVEVGDQVEAGTVLYQLDDTDAKLALKRAENQLQKSRSVGSYNSSPLRIYATESGVIQTLTIRNGNSVSAGQVIGTLLRPDESVVSITSSVSGTVYSVNVSQGVSVSAGTLLATVQDPQAELARRSTEYDQKSNEYDVEAAENQLKNYTIVSPVSGVVTEKNAKVGDNVAMADTKQPMMVITDTSSMRFTFQVEESRLSEVKPGLRASVTTESVPNKTFNGKIKSVSSEGIRDKNGKLMFDVEVLVENPGTLKSGMNISAKIILASANNALQAPAKALRNPDGKNAMVLVKSIVPPAATTASTTPTSDKEDDATNLEIPKGCRLASVQYGITDGTCVQIISGLKIGEVVVYSPDWETPDLKPVISTPTKPDSISTEVPNDSTDSDSDEALRKEIMDRVRESQEKANSDANMEI